MLTDTPSWCAVMTRPGAETAVAKSFEKDDDPHGQKPIEYYLPMLAVRDKRRKNELHEKPMFPCYIFAHINKKQILATRSTKGVLFLVTNRHEVITMRDSEIEAIRRFEATERQFQIRETSKLVKGARAKILNGEFAGLEGVLVKGDKEGNFAVNIEVMNTSFLVHIKRSELRSADAEDTIKEATL